MKYPEIDDYISKFESLTRTADYVLGNQETINMFLMGLNVGIATDLLKQNSNMGNYNQVKQRAVDATKARQLIDVLQGNRGTGVGLQSFRNTFGQRQPYQPPFQRNTQMQRPPNP